MPKPHTRIVMETQEVRDLVERMMNAILPILPTDPHVVIAAAFTLATALLVQSADESEEFQDKIIYGRDGAVLAGDAIMAVDEAYDKVLKREKANLN